MSGTLSANTTVSHYRIVRKLGAGGMGEVYLAEDTKLDRQVALKILPPEFAADKDRMSRFVREAKSASALNHPNIITIYEINEVDSTHFIAAEYIDGETLHTRLRHQPLDIRNALEIAIQIASALDAAHRVGIVHRDIKPENVMIRPDGLVKVLDFGIAKLSAPKDKLVDEEGETAIKPPSTNPGMIIGTANYMSPEQAKGKGVDARTDIFSFGIVLYEMFSGKRAFGGETPLEVISSILKDEPESIQQLVPALPREIERIVNRSLRKDAGERYQTARDLLTDLKDAKEELEFHDKLERTSAPQREEPPTQLINAPTSQAPPATSSAEYIAGEIKKHKLGVALGALIVLVLVVGVGFWFFFNRSANPKQIESIAVLPFLNESGNQEVEYLSDGMTETLISRLSQLPNMNVKARSSVFHYKGKETNARTVGRELSVQAVLNGHVLQRGEELTLTLELVDTQTENVIWSEQYSRRQADLINLQSQIARDVVSKLRSKLSGVDEQRLTKTYTTDPEAYQLYLKGLFYRSKRTSDDLKKGLEYFQQAIARDPNFALAYVGVAGSYSLFAVFGLVPTSEGYPRARAAAQKALEIDSTLPEAHAALADVAANYDWDWPLAEREYKRAIELNPNDAGAHGGYGLHYLIPMRRFDEAVQELRRAQELEPLSLSINAAFGAALTSARRYDEAITQLQRTVDLDPNFVVTRWRLVFAYSCAGRNEEAIAEAKKALEISNAPWSKSMLASAYARAGYREDALKLIEELKHVRPPNNTAFMIGRGYAELGDKDQAFEWLNKAYVNKDWMLPKIHVEPWIDGKLWKDNITPDPRMAELVRRMGLTP